jgi:Domain of unknown function (DUF1840)
MVYKFKSKASGDLIMLAGPGDQLMRLLGRESAAQGIIEVAAMPQALLALQEAIAEEARLQAQPTPQPAALATGTDADTAPAAAAVALRQRLWPMIDMLKRAHAANEPIVWGV